MPLTRDEESFLIDIVREAARQHILPRFRALPEDAIASKTADDDLVTIADQQAEKHIAAALAGGALGEVLVVGEEAVEEDPGLPGRIPGAARAVIVDPVDGTWNFAHGLANFGVIVAVVEEGETVFSLLYDPVVDDWILARKGGGTWFCRPDAEPRRLTMPVHPSPATGGFLPLRLFPLADQPRLAAEGGSPGRQAICGPDRRDASGMCGGIAPGITPPRQPARSRRARCGRCATGRPRGHSRRHSGRAAGRDAARRAGR